MRWTLAADLWPERSGLGTSWLLYSGHNDDTAATGGEGEERRTGGEQDDYEEVVVRGREGDEGLGERGHWMEVTHDLGWEC